MKKEDMISIAYVGIIIISTILVAIFAIFKIDIGVFISGGIVILFLLPMVILAIIWNTTKWRPCKWFCHDIIGWHTPKEESIEIDKYGFQYSATCKYCGKHIIQDSQGNWF